MNRLKELRKSNNMTLLEVANKLGVTESTVQRYESGVIENLKYDTIVKLSNLYRTSPAYLMGWTEADEDYNPLKNADIDALIPGYSYAKAANENDYISKIIDISLGLDDAQLEQLIQYAKFLESQEKK